jgi:aminopeptidase N
MEPTDARRMLPTWDEPAFRATFKLTVDVPATSRPIRIPRSRSRKSSTAACSARRSAVTPKMPSYLVVLVAGELERRRRKQDGVDIGVVTTEGKLPQAAFALQATKDLLRYYNNYFGVPYPLAKLDQIAIPGGFNGAMENWGGIVYNEATLLVDPKTSPDHIKQLTFQHQRPRSGAPVVRQPGHDGVVGQPVAQRRLCLLDGCQGHRALPPGVASPTWRPPTRGVMSLDARKTTHPIQTPVETKTRQPTPSTTSLREGPGLPAHARSLPGRRQFPQGHPRLHGQAPVFKYHGRRLVGGAGKGLRQAGRALAADWTTQPGYPLLKVAQSCEQGRRRITISQEQYWLDEQPATARLWQVPVELAAVGGKTSSTLLTGPSTTIYQPGCEGTVLVDPAGVGYYRVQYDSASFTALAGQSRKLGDSARLRLLSDTWSQAQSGRQPLSAWAGLAAAYQDEARAAIWSALASQLRALDTMAEGTPEQAAVRRFARTLAGPAFARLGWDEKPGESVDQRALRPLLATLLIRSGDENIIEQGRARFVRFRQNPSSAAPAMREVIVLAEGVRIGEASYATLAARLVQSDSAEERAAVAVAITSAADPALAARTLQLALSDALPAQITSLLVSQVADAGHIALAWDFAVQHRDALLRDQEALGKNAFFPSLVSRSADPAQAEMMERWVSASFGPEAEPEALKVGNAVRTRALHKQRLMPQVAGALASAPPA